MAFRDYSTTPASNTALSDGTYVGPNMLRNKVRPAIQQVMADGKDLADEVDALSAPLTVTSASGQSVSSRILLSAIAAPANKQSAILTEAGREGAFVFSTTNFVTSLGAALATIDPQQGVYVPPATDTTGASGAWVRQLNGGSLTAFMFGLVEGTDGGTAVQAWLDYIRAYEVPMASCTGAFNLAAGLTLGNGGAFATKNIRYGPVVHATAAMDYMLTVNTTGRIVLDWTGYEPWGSTSSSFDLALASRLAIHAVRLQECSRCQFIGTPHARNFYGWALITDTAFAQSYARIEFIKATNCGSCPQSSAANTLSTTWSAPARAGSSGVSTQTSTFTAAVVPTAVLNPATSGVPPMVAKILGEYYRVTGWSGTTVTVYPWLSDAIIAAATGTVEYIFGGAAAIIGGDASVVTIGRIDAFRCGFALLDRALYGANVGTLATNGVEIELAAGQGPTSAQLGGNIGRLYIEANALTILSFSSYDPGRVIESVSGTLDWAKVIQHAPRRTDNTFDPSLSALGGWIINHRDGQLYRDLSARGSNDITSSASIGLDVGLRRTPLIFRKDVAAITLTELSTDINRITGRDSQMVVVYGDQTNDAPTSVTFTPPAGGKINGGAADATLQFVGLSGPAEFSVYKNIANNDWRIRCTSGLLVEGKPGSTTVNTDAIFTLTPYASTIIQKHTGTLTANRVVTLSTTGAVRGNRFRIVRTGGGAFNLDIGGLKNLVTNTWADVNYDGAAWVLTAYGAL